MNDRVAHNLYKRVFIVEVTNDGRVKCIDEFGAQFVVALSTRAKGFAPSAGDWWIIDRTYGAWSLAVFLGAPLFGPGYIVEFGGPAVPDGWLQCNGTVKTRSSYSALFAVIGTTHNTGGETSQQFRLPARQAAGTPSAGTPWILIKF